MIHKAYLLPLWNSGKQICTCASDTPFNSWMQHPHREGGWSLATVLWHKECHWGWQYKPMLSVVTKSDFDVYCEIFSFCDIIIMWPPYACVYWSRHIHILFCAMKRCIEQSCGQTLPSFPMLVMQCWGKEWSRRRGGKRGKALYMYIYNALCEHLHTVTTI